MHIPEIRRSEHVFETKKEEIKQKLERLDSQENNNNKENIPMGTLKMRKSTTSRAESMKFKEKKFELFDEAEKNDENSLNNKDFDSEISHYEKNINCSDSNLNMNVFDGASKHAFKEVN